MVFGGPVWQLENLPAFASAPVALPVLSAKASLSKREDVVC